MTTWLQRDGVGLHWREDGDPAGAPVVLLNSLGTDLRLWDPVLPALAEYRVIRMDTRGHGLSDVPAAPYSLAMLTADAAALVAHLELGRFAIVGVSLGGMIAQALAAEMPDRTERVILSNTALRIGTPEMWADRIDAVQTGSLDGIADAVLERWFAPAFRAQSGNGLWRNMLTRTPAAGYAGCCAALAAADLTATAKEISCPALVIGGSDDGATPPAIVRELAAAIPHAEYVEIDGAGHLPMAETPDRFADLSGTFLKEPVRA
ncbi:MAG: 3-oxoadipate enol-lactonase [Pseudomonadota bacterium]